jgi:hypothetical protein
VLLLGCGDGGLAYVPVPMHPGVSALPVCIGRIRLTAGHCLRYGSRAGARTRGQPRSGWAREVVRSADRMEALGVDPKWTGTITRYAEHVIGLRG